MLKDRKSKWGHYTPESNSFSYLCREVRKLGHISGACAAEQVLLGNHLAWQICNCYPEIKNTRIAVVAHINESVNQVEYVRQGVSGPLSWGRYPVQVVSNSKHWIQERRKNAKHRRKVDITIIISLHPLLEEEKKRFWRLKDASEDIVFASVFGPQLSAQTTSTGTSDFYAVG